MVKRMVVSTAPTKMVASVQRDISHVLIISASSTVNFAMGNVIAAKARMKNDVVCGIKEYIRQAKEDCSFVLSDLESAHYIETLQ